MVRNQGENILDFILKLQTYSEKNASRLLFGIFSALQYLHEKSIVHRNVNNQNILVERTSSGYMTKVYDFGLATVVSTTTTLKTVCGTPTFMAPEMLHRTGYGTKVDIWSAGMITYTQFCGCPPFTRMSEEKLYRIMATGLLGFPSQCWSGISEPAKKLTQRMLQVNPHMRVNANQLLAHPWILQKDLAADHDIKPLVMRRMENCVDERRIFLQEPALPLLATSSLDR